AELLNKLGDIKVSWKRAYDDGNYFGSAIQYRILASTFPISISAQFKNAFIDERVDGDSRQFSFNADYDSIYVNVIAYDDVYNPSPYNIPTRVIFNLETSPVIFPNPYKYGEHSGGIKFVNLPSKLKVFNIYTIAGELVADLSSLEKIGIESQVEPGVTQNGFIWDLNNKKGNLISSGTYIYYMEDINGNKFKGKLSITK
ncbi:hypothetical protein KAU33_16730, partial [Candidatus Dependentiae bacterium]|nr:hypothetical protein [Candidatus Dependentiae bacterium]